MQKTKKILLSSLAVVTTSTSLAMVVAAAVTRGSNVTDRALLALLAAVICLCAHLLPALSRRPAVWLLWIACLAGTMFSQLSFFASAQDHSGTVRAEKSVIVSNSTQQIEATKQALSRITARNAAIVAKELAYAKSERRKAALSAELDEAHRAEKLQDALRLDIASDTSTRISVTTDPLLALLARYSGSNASGISLLAGFMFALILELLAVFLWCELLATKQLSVVPVASILPESTEAPEEAEPAGDEKLTELKRAIEAGKIKPTVAAIRQFLKCGQQQASEIRKTFCPA